jgi:flagellar biosynthesis/type III secretory pathway protein FliH
MLAETVEQWAKDWKQQGLEQGLEQGLQQGFQRGEASALKHLLIRRFKAIPPETLTRIGQATPGQLEQWLENILDAATLEDVFKAH